jgi:hypothetical protein
MKPTGAEAPFGYWYRITGTNSSWFSFWCTGVHEYHSVEVVRHHGESAQITVLLSVSHTKPEWMKKELSLRGLAVNYREPQKPLRAKNLHRNVHRYIAREKKLDEARGMTIF